MGLAPKGSFLLLLRLLQRLANGGAAHAELAGDIVLGDALTVLPEGLKASVFVETGSRLARILRRDHAHPPNYAVRLPATVVVLGARGIRTSISAPAR